MQTEAIAFIRMVFLKFASSTFFLVFKNQIVKNTNIGTNKNSRMKNCFKPSTD